MGMLEKSRKLDSRKLIFPSIFGFLVFAHFWRQSYKNTKTLHNLCLHFSRQDGQDGKKWKENQASKVTTIPKTKRRKYGMNKTCNCSKSKNFRYRGFVSPKLRHYI